MNSSSQPDDGPRDLPLLAFDVRGQALDDAKVQFSGQWQAQACCYDLHLAAFGHAAALTSDTLVADELTAAARQAGDAARPTAQPGLALASPVTGVLSTASPWLWAWGCCHASTAVLGRGSGCAGPAPVRGAFDPRGICQQQRCGDARRVRPEPRAWDAELLPVPRGKSLKAKAARVLRVPLTAANWAAYRAAQSALGRAGGTVSTSLDAVATPGDPSAPEDQP